MRLLLLAATSLLQCGAFRAMPQIPLSSRLMIQPLPHVGVLAQSVSLSDSSPTRTKILTMPLPSHSRSTTPRASAFAANVGAISLLPPVVTLVASVALKQVMLAMLLGIWSGAMILSGGNPVVAALRTFDTYVVQALACQDHAGVILFTTLLGGMLGLVQKSGGALGLAGLVKNFFTSRRRGGFSAMGLGALVFFDDYSSILIVGNSLRPLLRTVKLSAAKFAYIAHIMGVVLASLAPLSSWVGIQIGYLAAAYSQLGPAWANADPFLGFLKTIPYRFLPLASLLLLTASIGSGRDFGSMLEEERQAQQPSGATADVAAMKTTEQPQPAVEQQQEAGPLDPSPGTPLRARNALLPFIAVLAASFSGMVSQGLAAIAAMPEAVRPAASIITALRYSDSVTALIWGSACGWFASLALTLGQHIMTLSESMQAWVDGAKDVLEPTMVLILAWALGAVIADVGTAEFLATALQSGLPAFALPALISLLCWAISFACGSSIGTMGIVFPLVGPLALRMSGGDSAFIHKCFGAIMGGSLFGNLCSPISDTTILTVLATRCDLSTHVRTALLYSATAGIISLVLGDLAVGLGLYGPAVALALIGGTLCGVLRIFGKRI